jgi:phosphoglycolate phosphatase-like HAD superfamily hydrolase
MATRRYGLIDPAVDDYLVAFRSTGASRHAAHVSHPPVAAPRAIRGLLFEASDILYDDTSWRRWLLRLLMRLGLRAEFAPFFRVFDRDYLHDVNCGRRDFDDAVNAFLMAVGLSQGQAEEACRALQSYRLRAEADYRPLTGVRETLAQLCDASVTLGVLSNSERTGDALRQRLAALLGDLPWSAIISSRDLGVSMPAPTCYQSALAATKLTSAETAFIGRDASELQGAMRQGLTTVAFNADADAHADVYLQRFENLLELTRFSPARKAA